MKRIIFDNNISGIYKITCNANKKYYIGSSKDIKRRVGEHFYYADRGNHDSPYFQHTWNKYGKTTFEWCVIEECESNDEILIKREQFYFDVLKPKLNGTLIAGRAPITCRKVTLKNYKTNELVKCESGIEFSRTYNILHCQISSLLRGRIKFTGDWCLPDYEPKKYILRYKNEYDVTFWSPKEFCMEMGLNVNSLQRVLRRVHPIHKGWHYIDTEYNIPKIIARPFKYQITDPFGNIIHFERISQFAKQNNISKHGLSFMLRGKIKSHRGWTNIQKTTSSSRNQF